MTTESSSLTRRLEEVSRHRIASEEAASAMDPRVEAEDLLQGVGLSLQDTGGSVTVVGADPVVPSPLRLGTAATVSLLAKSGAAAGLHQLRGGPGQDLAIDLRSTPRRLCAPSERKWELIGRYPVTSTHETGAPVDFYRTRDNRWVLPSFYYPNLRKGANEFFGVPNTAEHISAAIAEWDGAELELAAADAGLVMSLVRTLPEMMAEEQYRAHLANSPLIEVVRVGDGPAEPLAPAGEMPFSGLRALGMGHVISGAGLGRSLALHGADVLNLWRPGECEHENLYATSNVGLRSAWIDPRRDRDAVMELLHGADIFFHNRRPAFLREIGLTVDEACRERPGLIYVSCTLHGLTGPWAERPGFDLNAGAVAGVMMFEGENGRPAKPPIGVVNDYLLSWLAQVGVVAALRRRAVEGGSYHVHVSLTRTALWLLSLGLFDRNWAHATAGVAEQHRYLAPELFTADTPLGRYQGVTDQVQMSATPGRYDPVLIARGSAEPRWLA